MNLLKMDGNTLQAICCRGQQVLSTGIRSTFNQLVMQDWSVLNIFDEPVSLEAIA